MEFTDLVDGISLRLIGNGIVWAAAVIGGMGLLHKTLILPSFRIMFRDIIKNEFSSWKRDIAKQLEEVKADITAIKHEVEYNDGSSLKDSVQRIERTLGRRLTKLELKIFGEDV